MHPPWHGAAVLCVAQVYTECSNRDSLRRRLEGTLSVVLKTAECVLTPRFIDMSFFMLK